MILGLDISTAVVGIAIFNLDIKLQELSYIKFKKGTNLFVKLNEFIEYYESKYSHLDITHIHIEEPLKKFQGKFSNADTIQKLTQMNSMISSYLFLKHSVEPAYFNVNHARSIVFKDLHFPKGHPNRKHLIWQEVMKAEPTINWRYKKSGLMEENYDMCDAWVAAMAGIIEFDMIKN